jgi:hypothetical protein
MTVVLYSTFLEHRERRQKKASGCGNVTTLDNAREHHSDRRNEENVDEPPHGIGTDGSEEPEHGEG